MRDNCPHKCLTSLIVRLLSIGFQTTETISDRNCKQVLQMQLNLMNGGGGGRLLDLTECKRKYRVLGLRLQVSMVGRSM